MNKVSPLDIRIVVATHPLVSNITATKKAPSSAAIRSSLAKGSSLSFPLSTRIQSLFLSKPKPSLEYPPTPLLQALFKKSRYYLIYFIEILNDKLEELINPTLRFEVAPRILHVPQLPEPPFRTARPARFFWHQDLSVPEDTYAPPCLLAERREQLPINIGADRAICQAAQALLDGKGVLQQADDGFVYLEVSGNFINALLPLLKEEPVRRLQPEAEPNYPKAHIAVILKKEEKAKEGWGRIKELGEEFSFTIEKCYSLKPALWPEMEQVYFLTVNSQDLERLRERYLLTPKINSHGFQLAFAAQEAEIPRYYEERKITYRLNVSCYAA